MTTYCIWDIFFLFLSFHFSSFFFFLGNFSWSLQPCISKHKRSLHHFSSCLFGYEFWQEDIDGVMIPRGLSLLLGLGFFVCTVQETGVQISNGRG
ncbi:hypothetical protein VTN96DRAFT_7822 [Rasamsonia emersonii]